MRAMTMMGRLMVLLLLGLSPAAAQLRVNNLIGFGGGSSDPAVTFDGSLAGTANASGVLAYTVAGTIPAGSVLVAGYCFGTGSTVSVTDSRGNTYSPDTNLVFGSVDAAIVSSRLATTLQPGDTITFDNATNSANNTLIAVAWVPNAAASPFDVASTAGVSSAGPMASGTTAALAQANEVVFGWATRTAAVTITEDATFTNLALMNWGATSRAAMGYRLPNATTGQQYAPTFSGASGNWLSLVATYKLN